MAKPVRRTSGTQPRRPAAPTPAPSPSPTASPTASPTNSSATPESKKNKIARAHEELRARGWAKHWLVHPLTIAVNYGVALVAIAAPFVASLYFEKQEWLVKFAPILFWWAWISWQVSSSLMKETYKTIRGTAWRDKEDLYPGLVRILNEVGDKAGDIKLGRMIFACAVIIQVPWMFEEVRGWLIGHPLHTTFLPVGIVGGLILSRSYDHWLVKWVNTASGIAIMVIVLEIISRFGVEIPRVSAWNHNKFFAGDGTPETPWFARITREEAEAYNADAHKAGYVIPPGLPGQPSVVWFEKGEFEGGNIVAGKDDIALKLDIWQSPLGVPAREYVQLAVAKPAVPLKGVYLSKLLLREDMHRVFRTGAHPMAQGLYDQGVVDQYLPWEYRHQSLQLQGLGVWLTQPGGERVGIVNHGSFWIQVTNISHFPRDI